jgi:hypothetical protein
VSTVDAFLAAVAEAGHPARFEGFVAGGKARSYSWPHPGMPPSVGERARNLTGLQSATPEAFVTETRAWLRVTLWDNDRPPAPPQKGV